MDRTSSKKTRRSHGRTLLVGTPTPFISAPLSNNNPASATHKNPQKAKDYVNQKTKFIKLKKDMKSLFFISLHVKKDYISKIHGVLRLENKMKLQYYKVTQVPLKRFIGVTLTTTMADCRHSCTLCPKSFVQKCHLNRHMLTHEEAKFPRSQIPNHDAPARHLRRRHAQPRIVGTERSTLRRRHHSPNVATS